MISKDKVINEKLGVLVRRYPFLLSFFQGSTIELDGNEEKTTVEVLEAISEEEREDKAIDNDQVIASLVEFINQMLSFIGEDDNSKVRSVSILPGTDKSGNPEAFDKLEVKQSEIICIVGPTGSGKSRLLGDIEWVAQKDTPTSRTILINGEKPDSKWRFSSAHKLVAQLSQNMNFVMDLTVEEFLELHAESRLVENRELVVEKIIEAANALAGESFAADRPITSLSGGQSRALMIADTAILSKSPIILIDEIENAGIDRKKALELLTGEEKIVLMATHDPILALMGDRRIVIKNGGIHKVIETSEEEKALLSKLEETDKYLQNMRGLLRSGESLRDI
ncbi:MAG: ATP-binding cassette domain-containing protein [Hyphomicrobiales bacterium]